ncbi:MAG: oligosaccharide flippase family protein, partial [Anaerolineae bacterium]|nr:oligosaccharide flippase family protein [Anaerolineae bacterium]
RQLQQGMLMAIRYVSLVTFPAGIGMALVSEVFTEVVFGKDWIEAAPIMGALAIYGIFLSVSWNIGDIYKAIGRPDILWKTSIFEFALLGPVLYALAHESAFAVSVGHAAVAFVVSASRLTIGSWLVEVPMTRILRQFIPATVGSIVMGLAVAGMLVVTAEWPKVLALVVLVLTGAVSYSIAMWGFEREKIMQLRMQFSGSN